MPVCFGKLPANNPAIKGQLAARKQFFNDYRYAVAPLHTRFDKLVWFVWDAEVLDETGHAKVIRQEDTLKDALKNL